MTDDAFLQAIIDNPDDDAPRLVYADYLMGHGQPERAEFIQVQCQLAPLSQSDPLRRQLNARAQQLLRENGQQWSASPWTYRFHRGFIESVTLEVATFLDHADELFQKFPLREVVLYDAHEENLPDLATSQHLAKLSSLILDGGYASLGDQELATLMQSPYLANLKALSLAGNEIADRGVEALAASPSLTKLETLNLGRNAIGPAGARALALTKGLPRLTALHLGSNHLRGDGLAALATSPQRSGLQMLTCYANELQDGGVRTLASSPYLAHLASLNLGWNNITDEGGRALVTSPYLRHIEWLDLERILLSGEVKDQLRARFGNHVHF